MAGVATIERTRMSLIASTAGIVLFSFTSGIAMVATVMLSVFMLAILFLTFAPLRSSDWAGREDATAAASAEPSDD
ncbi:hypothetical protein C478_13667 [Natrinema thermotolerans DSM 11552]|nr:hypothetical protein C478_13667 [Natrinema thermotolerans DSM 11552]